MPEYDVILIDDAKLDLHELDDYITFELNAPETAETYVNDILDEIANLCTRANHFRLVDDEPWHSRGQRRMNSKRGLVAPQHPGLT